MRKFGVVPGLFAGLVLLSLPAVSSAGVFLSINIAPPALQVYQQPLCPTDGYLWTPGYWGYGDAGYYWIPGAWVAPPQAGFLWTPGYWGFSNGLYAFNAGYWGPTVGFYGGVNYGFGYGGSGFDGGRWQGGHFAYNTAVSRVNTTVIHNTYNQGVANRGNNRTSFNGGPGGVSARPSSAETAMSRQHNQPAAEPGPGAGCTIPGTGCTTTSGSSPACGDSRCAQNARPAAWRRARTQTPQDRRPVRLPPAPARNSRDKLPPTEVPLPPAVRPRRQDLKRMRLLPNMQRRQDLLKEKKNADNLFT